ncbi:MAG: adenylate/guanylate cyclase domain-containing protein [Spirochaetaceae bacterium]|nr:MAG: adenylate/guanylate cyclase domain-containing protein [Spirochaetaceae bacterium]
MNDPLSRVFGQKVSGTRVVPLILKIVVIFTVFLLVSNFTTNYINLMLNRGEQIRLLNQLLVKDLKEMHVFAGNQFEIFSFNPDEAAAVRNLENAAVRNHRGARSLSMGVRPEGAVFFQAGELERQDVFTDEAALERMRSALAQGVEEGTLRFTHQGFEYFGVYKYSSSWGIFQIRAEELTEFYADSVRIFRDVSLIIVGITIIFALVGILILRRILRFVRVITDNIMRMQAEQSLELMDLKGAPNDDVTYLGIAFNSLANTIDNLMGIFKKFVARDVATKAYREREIRLEGTKRELTILFTDIKSFTFMTETLGTDIIKLLNLHYDQAIRHIHDYNGDIGSIIGDALLAIFGTVEEDRENKSVQSLRSAYKITEVAANLREEMHKRRELILQQRGSLTEAEENVYRAVLLEVGVGLDGGQVFYGNIGSYERMVNTVIGDNVNSSARLEGLTRFYKVPIICSEYVKDEIMEHSHDYAFVELDRVQVKGKTLGKKIFWPVHQSSMDEELRHDIELFSEGLHSYYQGDWVAAVEHFDRCKLVVSDVFRERISGKRAPEGWNGIWTMTEK